MQPEELEFPLFLFCQCLKDGKACNEMIKFETMQHLTNTGSTRLKRHLKKHDIDVEHTSMEECKKYLSNGKYENLVSIIEWKIQKMDAYEALAKIFNIRNISLRTFDDESIRWWLKKFSIFGHCKRFNAKNVGQNSKLNALDLKEMLEKLIVPRKEKENDINKKLNPESLAKILQIEPKLLISISKDECKIKNGHHITGYVLSTLTNDLKVKQLYISTPLCTDGHKISHQKKTDNFISEKKLGTAVISVATDHAPACLGGSSHLASKPGIFACHVGDADHMIDKLARYSLTSKPIGNEETLIDEMDVCPYRKKKEGNIPNWVNAILAKFAHNSALACEIEGFEKPGKIPELCITRFSNLYERAEHLLKNFKYYCKRIDIETDEKFFGGLRMDFTMEHRLRNYVTDQKAYYSLTKYFGKMEPFSMSYVPSLIALTRHINNIIGRYPYVQLENPFKAVNKYILQTYKVSEILFTAGYFNLLYRNAIIDTYNRMSVKCENDPFNLVEKLSNIVFRYFYELDKATTRKNTRSLDQIKAGIQKEIEIFNNEYPEEWKEKSKLILKDRDINEDTTGVYYKGSIPVEEVEIFLASADATMEVIREYIFSCRGRKDVTYLHYALYYLLGIGVSSVDSGRLFSQIKRAIGSDRHFNT